MNHTPTPWKIQTTNFGYTTIFDHYGFTICATSTRKPDFERILECVNALEGIANPIDFVSAVKALNPHDVINDVKERDHLRNLLSEIRNDLCRLSAEMTIEDCDIVNNLALKIEKYEQ